ncbi:hypothetical protein [Rhodococcus sp. 14-2470-1b]|uniref:hypothetical protein n=1 Tax=Rhodococcus sp. 14-2470-1b TaxID=2023149 RepID=UPI00159533CC|nr:hypothetical protein [Rhodococcus sp. 14-2470-1b]
MSDEPEIDEPDEPAVPMKSVPITRERGWPPERPQMVEVPAENADDWDERIWH